MVKKTGFQPYFSMDDLGGFPIIFGNTHIKNCQNGVVAVGTTVDGRNPANQLSLVVFFPLFTGFIHPRWCRISSEPSKPSLLLGFQNSVTFSLRQNRRPGAKFTGRNFTMFPAVRSRSAVAWNVRG